MLKTCSIIIPCYRTSFIDLEKSLYEIKKNWTDKSIIINFILILDGGLTPMSKEFKDYYEIKKKFSEVKLLLNKNRFGQQHSILNGFDFAESDLIITIDDDDKYPTINLCELAKKLYNSNYDCFIGKPINNNVNFVRSLGTKVVKNIFNKVYGNKKNKIYFSSFRILKKKIYKNIIMKNYLLPVIGYMIIEETNSVCNFDYENDKKINKSRYNYWELFLYFLKMNFFYTGLFYKLFLYCAVLITILSLGLTITYLYNYFFTQVEPGFTTIVLLQLFIIQIILYSSSFILKYLTSFINTFKNIKLSKNKLYKEIF